MTYMTDDLLNVFANTLSGELAINPLDDLDDIDLWGDDEDGTWWKDSQPKTWDFLPQTTKTKTVSANPELAKHWMSRYQNGQVPEDALEAVGGGFSLRPDAADSYKSMERAARKMGINLGLVSAYRDRERQQELYFAYKSGDGNLAAKPGHSNHGWGISIDADEATIAFLEKHGEKFGWVNDVEGEPWHWTFQGGGKVKPKVNADRKPRRARPSQSRADTPSALTGLTDFDPFVAIPGSLMDVMLEGPARSDEPKKTNKSGGVPSYVPKQYRAMVRRASDASGLPARLIAAVARLESGGFSPDVMNFQRSSSAGALGPMQVMPLHTATYGHGFTQNTAVNFIVGAKILAGYLKHARGDLRLGLAYYNAGPGASANLIESVKKSYSDKVLSYLRGN